MNKRKVKGVICVNTQERFSTMKDACSRFNIDKAVVSKASNGKRDTAGKYKGESLKWMLIEDWDKLSKREQLDIISAYRTNLSDIICLNTKVSFKDIDEASRCYDIPHRTIYKSCMDNKVLKDGKVTYGGKYRKEKLIWMQKEDFNKLSEFEISKYKILSKERKQTGTTIICLNTGEVFPSIEVASIYYDLSPKELMNCCNGRRNHVGEKDGEYMKWMPLEKYEKLTKQEVEEIIKTNNIKKIPVVCLNTGEEFESIRQASLKYKTTSPSIHSCCKGLSSHAGVHNGEKLVWAFPSEYKKYTKKRISKILSSVIG